MIVFTDSRIPWTTDQLVARPLPKHMPTQTQNQHIHTPNIHALSGIRTHDPSVRASEDIHALERSATVTGQGQIYLYIYQLVYLNDRT
jgi:hypothetical protein